MQARRIVGWNVRHARVGQGLTIEELAGNSEVDASYVARVERGTVNVSIDVIERIAKALRLRPIDLLVEPAAGSKPPKPLKAGRRPSK